MTDLAAITKQVERWKAISPQRRVQEARRPWQKAITLTYALDTTRALAWNGGITYILSPLGYCVCVTCGVPVLENTKSCQGGHFVPAAGTRRPHVFDIRNCHPQCTRCNEHRSGSAIQYEGYMLKRYGQHVIDQLKKMSAIGTPLSDEQLARIAIESRAKVRELKRLL
jgi:hypothetical protein